MNPSRHQNAPFGSILTDKMAIATYRDGAWSEAEIRVTGPLEIHPAAHALHYGSSCFEGFKAYRRADGSVHIFRMDRHVAPAEHLEVLLLGDLLDECHGLISFVRVHREERDTRREPTCFGKFEGDLVTQEPVRHVDQDPRAVAGIRLGTGGATVIEVVQRGERLLNDVVARPASQCGDEGHTAVLRLRGRVVEPLGRWHGAVAGCGVIHHPDLRRWVFVELRLSETDLGNNRPGEPAPPADLNWAAPASRERARLHRRTQFRLATAYGLG